MAASVRCSAALSHPHLFLLYHASDGKPMTNFDEIKQRIDIVAFIGAYVHLKPQGRVMMGQCPFHEDRSPSFAVYRDSGTFYCFGCQSAGDVVEFARRYFNEDYASTRDRLMRWANLNEGSPTKTRRASSDHSYSSLRPSASPDNEGAAPDQALWKAAIQAWHERLYTKEGAPFRSWLNERQVPEEIWRRFSLGAGFTDARDLYHAIKQCGYDFPTELATTGIIVGAQKAAAPVRPADKLASVGMIARTRNAWTDAFQGRITIPVVDRHGFPVGVVGRSIADHASPKYRAPKGATFPSSGILFGLPQALNAIIQTGKIVLVEGYFDVIHAHMHPGSMVVGALGAHLTSAQAATIRTILPQGQVILAFDGDAGGARGTLTTIQTLIRCGIGDIRIAFLPAGKDPDDIIKDSRERWNALVEEPHDPWESDLIIELLYRIEPQAQSDQRAMSKLIELAQRHLQIAPCQLIQDIARRLSRSLHIAPGLLLPPRSAASPHAHPLHMKTAFAVPSIRRSPDAFLARIARQHPHLFRQTVALIVEASFSSEDGWEVLSDLLWPDMLADSQEVAHFLARVQANPEACHEAPSIPERHDPCDDPCPYRLDDVVVGILKHARMIVQNYAQTKIDEARLCRDESSLHTIGRLLRALRYTDRRLKRCITLIQRGEWSIIDGKYIARSSPDN